MIYSIDGALRDLNSVLNRMEGVKSTLTNEARGGKGTFINIRKGPTAQEPGFGKKKVFHDIQIITSFQGKNATNEMANIQTTIVNAIEQDPRRDQNAQETVIGPWEPDTDSGRDGVVEILSIVIRTEETTC